MPLTIQFGPWAPDLNDTPMQMPDSTGPVPIPCADILNVFYSNGSYRSIPGPIAATIDGNPIAAISTTPVSAFSFFDNVAQQETVFAGTAVGVQQLNADGSWSMINLVTSQSAQLVGQSMKLALGNFLNTTSLSSMVITSTIGKFSVQLTGATIVAGQIVTAFPGSKVSPGAPSSYLTGYSSVIPIVGTLAGQGTLFGGKVQIVRDYYGGDGSIPAGATFSVGTASDPGKSVFTTITANGTTLTSAAAGYGYSSATQQATWFWAGSFFGLAPGTTYPITFS